MLFMSDLWLEIIDSSYTNPIKKQRINTCSMASKKILGLMFFEDEKQGIEPPFY